MENIKNIIKSYDLSFVKEFLAKGYDINKQYADGETLLIMACEFQSLEIVEYLVSLGANPKIKEKNGYDAEGVALWHGESPNGFYGNNCKSIISALKNSNENT